MSPPSNPPRRLNAGVRWAGLGFFGGLLVLLGQFQEQVFAGLGRLGGVVGLPGALGPARGLSQHSLPSSVIYHLLYAGASIGVLHLLLRGRGTWRVVGGFGAALLLGTALVVAGRLAGGAALAAQGHLLLDFASSPLALLAGYALASFGRPGASGAGPAPRQPK